MTLLDYTSNYFLYKAGYPSLYISHRSLCLLHSFFLVKLITCFSPVIMAHAEARKLSTELGIKSSAAKFYNLLTTQLHEVQNLTGSVHETKLHEGECDWHAVGSLKHWTYVIGT